MLAALGLCLMQMLTAFGQSIGLRADPATPIVGENFRLTVDLQGINGQIGVAEWPQCDGAQFNWNDRSSSTQFVNGQVSQNISFGATAVREGEFTISPIKLQYNGQVLVSNATRIKVTRRQSSNLFLLRLHAAQKDIYMGQIVPLYIDYLIADQEVRALEPSAGSYDLAIQYDGFTIPDSWRQDFIITPQTPADRQSQGQHFGSQVENTVVGDFSYRVQRITLLLQAQRTGRVELPAIATNFYRLQPQRTFFNVTLTRAGGAIPATSPAFLLNVMEIPPPPPGKVSSGWVLRQLRMELMVDDFAPGQEVDLHSPIPVRLQFGGDVPAEFLRLPAWNLQTALLKDFNISDNEPLRELRDGSALFSEIHFRPRHVGIDKIPPIVLTYFDPVEQVWKDAQTQPFPITVRAPAQGMAMSSPPPVLLLSEEPQAAIGGLEGPERSPQILLKPAQGKSYPWGKVLLAAIPWLVMLGVRLAPGLKRRALEQRQAQAWGLADSLRRIKASGSSDEILDIVGRYMQRRFGLSDPHALRLKDEALARRFLQTLESFEAARYAGRSGQSAPDTSEIRELLKELEVAE